MEGEKKREESAARQLLFVDLLKDRVAHFPFRPSPKYFMFPVTSGKKKTDRLVR